MERWLCVVTSRQRFSLSPAELIRRVRWLAEAGVDLVQIRERDLSDRALLLLVRDAVEVTRGTGARVVVNDRFDVAVAAGADGVHLREDSTSAERIRPFAPPEFLIGCSIHDIDRARASSACDYLLFGTVFPSGGKPSGHPVAGLERLREVCAAAAQPVLGIGGIAPVNAREVAGAGAAGAAAMDSLLSASSAGEAREIVRAFRKSFESADRC
ncbi:MAG TPA: thiamine phosphate synthase [Vicinamibacterales bacterium]|jgi:thiamine-phosphate pyrophosphorylase|nr:thiamine phosphate synthase [Vicinamibacterales bacterium]